MSYDPQTFWNEKARRATDPFAAVCRTDPIASRNIDGIQRSVLGRALVPIKAETVLAGKRVLDYGCGVGRFAPYFEAVGCNYSGVDIADEMIAKAQALHPGRDFRCLSNSRIPYADESFNVVVSIGVIHHNQYEQQEQILDEILRVLRHDGYIVLFESVGKPDPANEMEFARPLDDWLTTFESRGMSSIYVSGARYGMTRTACAKASRLLRRTAADPRVPKWVDSLGLWADPVLGRFLPRKYQRRAAMVFRRGTPRL